MLDEHASGGTLALALLACRAWDAPDGAVRRRLSAWAEAPGGSGETRGLALAVLALAEAGNPLLLEGGR
jgi:hypothetical protein